MVLCQNYYSRAIGLAFFIIPFFVGSLFVRIGDIQVYYQIEKDVLGFCLLGYPVGLQLALFLIQRTVEILSFRQIMVLVIFTIAGAMTAISFGSSPFLLCVSLFLVGLCMGIMKVVLNLEAESFSHTFNRCIMARSHAFGSLGLFFTTIFGALLVYWNVFLIYHFMIVGLVSVIAVVVVFQRYSLFPPGGSAQAGKGLFVKPTRSIILLFGVCLSSVMIEMTIIDWSVIFMRDLFHMPPFVNMMGLAMMALFQFFVRYYSHYFVDLLGVMGSIITSLFVLSLGMLMVVMSNFWGVAIIGCGLVGVGLSIVFPVVMVLASQLKERAAVLSLISLNQVVFTSVLCVPAILGMIAENIGIRYAFSLSFPFLAVSFGCLFIFNAYRRHQPA